MTNLEPASALAAIDMTPIDHPKTSGEVFAFQLLTESWIDETGQHDQKRMGQLIEADRDSATAAALAPFEALAAEFKQAADDFDEIYKSPFGLRADVVSSATWEQAHRMLIAAMTQADALEKLKAAVREPLERQVRELEERNAAGWSRAEEAIEELEETQERIASLEAQLVTAREGALKEAVAAIEALDIVQGRKNEYEVGQQRGLDVALDAVEALLTSPPPRVDGWIAVSERLPEKGERVMFWLAGGPLEGGVICTGALSKNKFATVWLDDETHDDACIEWHTDDVTHWMPLPAPPSQPDAGTETER